MMKRSFARASSRVVPPADQRGPSKGNASKRGPPILLFALIVPLIGVTWVMREFSQHAEVSEAAVARAANEALRQKVLPEEQRRYESPRSENVAQSATIMVGEKALPSAKNLLHQSPPYKTESIIKLSDTLTTSPNTVVTAYFNTKSKFSAGDYSEWMKNMLSLQDAMVIFTSANMVEPMKEFRQHAKDRTVIVPLELDQLPIGTLYSQEFWQDQLDRDPEKRRHRSYQLFWIWLSKSWFVTQAMDMDFFKSDLFMWSDIGCFRKKKYNGKTMIQHREIVPPNEVLQMAHHPPNPPAEEFFNDKYKRKPNFYHSGSQLIAFKDTWSKFHEYFLDTIDGFLERKMIIVEDQAVLQSVCLRFPKLCAYVPYDQVDDNHYWGLRFVLHRGGKYNYWRYDKEGAKQRRR